MSFLDNIIENSPAYYLIQYITNVRDFDDLCSGPNNLELIQTSIKFREYNKTLSDYQLALGMEMACKCNYLNYVKVILEEIKKDKPIHSIIYNIKVCISISVINNNYKIVEYLMDNYEFNYYKSLLKKRELKRHLKSYFLDPILKDIYNDNYGAYVNKTYKTIKRQFIIYLLAKRHIINQNIRLVLFLRKMPLEFEKILRKFLNYDVIT